MLTLCALSVVQNRAAANGRAPATSSIVLRPGAPADLFSGTTFGAVVSRDRGATWRWICEAAIGYGGSIDPLFVWTRAGAMYAVMQGLIAVSNDFGCSWQPLGSFGNGGAVDLVVHPGDDAVFYVATGHAGGDVNAVYRTRDSGRTFERTAIARPDLLFTSVRLAPSAPDRIYAAAWDLRSPRATLFRSDDAGATVRELSLGVDRPQLAHVLAVSPTDPDVVYVSVALATEPGERLLRSNNGGASFEELQRLERGVHGFAVGTSGTTFVAALHGLYRRRGGAANAELLPALDWNLCVAFGQGTLFACGGAGDDFALGSSSDEGDTWQPVLELTGIAGPLECPAGSPTERLCTPQWPALRAQIAGMGFDGGVTEADGSAQPAADGGARPVDGGRCGCGSAPAGLFGALFVLFFVTLLRVRRARRKGGA